MAYSKKTNGKNSRKKVKSISPSDHKARKPVSTSDRPAKKPISPSDHKARKPVTSSQMQRNQEQRRKRASSAGARMGSAATGRRRTPRKGL